jgi:hypothetical protein
LEELLPGREWREIRQVVYSGRSKYLEKERLTRDEFEALPELLMKYLRFQDGTKTEAEWVEFFATNDSGARPHYYLKLNAGP